MKKCAILLLCLLILSGCASAPSEKRKTVLFYPPLPQSPRLQFLTTISGEADLGREQSALETFLLGPPESLKTIGKAYDIAAVKGRIYVLDRTARKLLILNLAERRFDYLRDERLGTLSDPSGIWVSNDDVKYIADMQRKQVVVFGRDNHFVRAYGGKDLFDKPVDVAVFGDTVYVCDMNKHQVLALDRGSGRLKRTIGELGSGKGQFYRPSHVTVDRDGNLFVNDAFNFRIQKFDPQGTLVRTFGRIGDNLGAFARPKGIAVDRQGYLYVVDAAFENVQIFDSRSGQLMLFFGGAGTTPGSMYLPAGIHIDYDNVDFFRRFADKDFRLEYVLYVGNYFGPNRLNVYGFGKWVGQPLSATPNAASEPQREAPKAE